MAADDWIKMRVHLRDDPGTVMIQAKTGLDLDTIVGKLHRFWSWADAHVSEGRRCARCAQSCAPCARCQQGSDDGFAQGIAQDWVDAYLGHPGFAAALVDAGWARFNAQGIVLPRYTSNNGSTGKGRAQAAKRQARRRGASRPRHDPVTPERDNSVTRGEERRGEKKRDLPSVPASSAPVRKSPPTPPKEGAARPRSEGMDGRTAALAEAGIGGKWADVLLASPVTEAEIIAETQRAKASKTVRSVEAVVASSLARRHGVELPGRKLRLNRAETDFLDSVHQRRNGA